MSIVIELTLEESVDPHEVQRLLIDFLKASPPIFKSMNIRYLRLGKNDGTEEHLVNLTDASEDFGCTTCCMDDMEESTIMNFDGNLVPRDPNGILFNDRDTNQELNNTFYMDCENHSNSIVKEETSTFVLKREPSMDVSSLQQFYTKTTSKRKSSLKELETSTKAISQNAVKPRNITSTMHSTQNAEGPEKSMNFVEDQVNKASNRAIDDSVFDRPTLGEFKNDNEKVDETKEKGAEKDSLLDEVNKDLNVDEFESDPHEASETSERTKSNLNEIAHISNGERVKFENNADDKISNIDDSSSDRSASNPFKDDSVAEVDHKEPKEKGTEDDLEDIDNISNGAIDDSSFDRSSLYELENELEEPKEEEKEDEVEQRLTENPPMRFTNLALVDILEAAKRGDLTINESMADVSFVSVDLHDEALISNNEIPEDYEFAFEVLKIENDGIMYKRRILWKNVKCKLCSVQNFRSLESGITHLLTKHCDKYAPKIFRCKLCSATSFYKRNLGKQHVQKKHRLQYRRNISGATIEEKWHPLTLMETLKVAKEAFPQISKIIERYLVWVVKSGKLDMDALRQSPDN
ncbi:unnamed protein product, partial [Mesorhabditis belari]|uniref:C2H2-type domain-containing protein n=1 Tax=Mesorhabditis belari TaxID=2138241 RepID=A0AAF3F4D7_9BILA